MSTTIEEVSSELVDNVIDAKEVMAMIKVKSPTTLNKHIKAGRVPKPFEWPPGTKNRGWLKSEVIQAVNTLMMNAAKQRDQETQ